MYSGRNTPNPTATALALLLSVIITATCSCSHHYKNRKITERLNAREIILPDSMNVINADQIENPELLSTDGKMKILFYIGPDECSACRVSDIHFADTLFNILPTTELVPLVIVNPDDNGRKGTLQKLHDSWFEFPIYEDVCSEFMKLNPAIPKDSRFHSFMLDGEDKVILVGNPARSPQILNLYKEVLSGFAEKQKPTE